VRSGSEQITSKPEVMGVSDVWGRFRYSGLKEAAGTANAMGFEWDGCPFTTMRADVCVPLKDGGCPTLCGERDFGFCARSKGCLPSRGLFLPADSSDNCSIATTPATPPIHASLDYGACSEASRCACVHGKHLVEEKGDVIGYLPSLRRWL